MFDVVVVPDFRPGEQKKRNAACFEARTLLFLASWLQNAGQARYFPLHLVCIGKPPKSVRTLAKRANAIISVHEPFGSKGRLGGFTNKLRGLEVCPKTKRVLMVDTDILFCSDPSSLFYSNNCLAVRKINRNRFSTVYWQRIYEAVGMQPPRDQSNNLDNSSVSKMYPNFNTGVIYMSWKNAKKLRPLWEDHLLRIDDHRSDERVKADTFVGNDEVSFTTAAEYLKKEEGLQIKPLSKNYNTTVHDLCHGRLAFHDIKILHLFDLFKMIEDVPKQMESSIREYRMAKFRRVFQILRNQKKKRWGERISLTFSSCITISQLGHFLDNLYRSYVKPVLQSNEMCETR